jgi:phospholipid N-methyltransferase
MSEGISRINFFREGLKNLRTVGTVTPSSRFLCEAMLKPINFAEAKVLVELGAGNGVITRHILRKMHPDAHLQVFEVQANFCQILRNIDDPRLIVIEGSAEHLPAYLAEHGFTHADHIISAIPFVILPKELARDIVATCHDCLAPGGHFVQMHYSMFLKSFYEEFFGEVRVRFCARNFPPAFVFACNDK